MQFLQIFNMLKFLIRVNNAIKETQKNRDTNMKIEYKTDRNSHLQKTIELVKPR